MHSARSDGLLLVKARWRIHTARILRGDDASKQNQHQDNDRPDRQEIERNGNAKQMINRYSACTHKQQRNGLCNQVQVEFIATLGVEVTVFEMHGGYRGQHYANY